MRVHVYTCASLSVCLFAFVCLYVYVCCDVFFLQMETTNAHTTLTQPKSTYPPQHHTTHPTGPTEAQVPGGRAPARAEPRALHLQPRRHRWPVHPDPSWPERGADAVGYRRGFRRALGLPSRRVLPRLPQLHSLLLPLHLYPRDGGGVRGGDQGTAGGGGGGRGAGGRDLKEKEGEKGGLVWPFDLICVF